MNILIIESDGKRVIDFLELFGKYYIDIAVTEQEAKVKLSTKEYDLVFFGGTLINGDVVNVAKFLVNNIIYKPIVYLHSINFLLIEKLQKIIGDVIIAPYGTDEFYETIN